MSYWSNGESLLPEETSGNGDAVSEKSRVCRCCWIVLEDDGDDDDNDKDDTWKAFVVVVVVVELNASSTQAVVEIILFATVLDVIMDGMLWCVIVRVG